MISMGDINELVKIMKDGIEEKIKQNKKEIEEYRKKQIESKED